MLNQDAAHRVADAQAATQFVALGQSAARTWRALADQAQNQAVQELFRDTAAALEKASGQVKRKMPQVMG